MKKTMFFALTAAFLLTFPPELSAALFSTKTKNEDTEAVQKTTKQKPENIKASPKSSAGGGSIEGDGGDEGAEGESGKSSFMGVKVNGKKEILFIVDTSSSMGAPTPESGSRINVLKNELRFAVEKAYDDENEDESGHYRIIEFNSYVRCFPEKGKRRFQKNPDKEFRHFVDNMGPSGGTSMMMAWITAAKMIKRENAKFNVIYFLTDGDPTDCTHADLIEYIRKNIPKRVRIHCFSIGQQSPLMQAIAKLRNGKYRPIQ